MSFAGKKMAASMVDDLPPPDRLKRRPPGDEGEMADTEEPDEGATMGDALAKALEGGDGAAIYSAFKDLADHCSGGE